MISKLILKKEERRFDFNLAYKTRDALEITNVNPLDPTFINKSLIRSI